MNIRLLGTLSIIGGVCYSVMAVYSAVMGRNADTPDVIGQLLSIAWIVGAICGWLGFIAVRGTGNNVAVRFLSFLPVVGLAMVLIFSSYALLAGISVFSIPFAGVGLMLELFGSVLNTIFAIATSALTGWRKFAPLSVVMGVVLGGVLSGLAGPGVIFGVPLCLGISYAILGYAVRTVVPVERTVMQPA